MPLVLDEAQAALGNEAWQTAWSEGATISDVEVLGLARNLL
jgi:hypothetical protein